MVEPVTPNGWHQYRIAFFISLAGSIVLGLVSLESEDYYNFTIYWNKFLNGQIEYTYPIGFLVFFSGLYRINFKLPKLVFLAFHVITSYQVFRLLSKREDFGKRELFSITFYLFNPVLCITSIYPGLFDTVIGFLVLNFVLLLESKKGNKFLKDAIALLLIGLIISIKFVGVVIVIPYLLQDWKTMLRRVLLVIGGLALVFGALTLMHIPISTIIQPFLTHADRTMLTIFDAFKVDPPLFITAFRDFYSPIAIWVTIIALVSFDLLFFIKKFRFRVRVALDIIVFITFFSVSNAQYHLWYMALFVMAYNEYVPTKEAMYRKMKYHQLFLISLAFLAPFAQFLNLFFIYDIFKKETQFVKDVIIDPNLAEASARVSV